VVRKRRLQLQCDEFPCFAFACAECTPRGAYAPRSWLHPRVSSRMRGCALQRRFVCHGGLTPPALDCCTIVRPWKTAFCDAQTHVRRSAVRQPAVVRDTDAVPRESSIVRRPTTHDQRAAGVSPPWLVTPTLYREKSSIVPRPTNGQRRAAGVSPPGVCKPRLQMQCDEFSRFACACAECIPQGA
jgi:hypothetical protein